MSITTSLEWTSLMFVGSNTDINSEQGLSLPTDFTLAPSVPVADLNRLLHDPDPRWLSWTYPWSPKSYLKTATHIRWFSPVNGAQHPSIIELWLTPVASTDSFTTEMLGSNSSTTAPKCSRTIVPTVLSPPKGSRMQRLLPMKRVERTQKRHPLSI